MATSRNSTFLITHYVSFDVEDEFSSYFYAVQLTFTIKPSVNESWWCNDTSSARKCCRQRSSSKDFV